MHIGERIREIMREKRIPVVWLARQINCERTNVYNIFARRDINTQLLQMFCVVLNHDFFKELSVETFGEQQENQV